MTAIYVFYSINTIHRLVLVSFQVSNEIFLVKITTFFANLFSKTKYLHTF